MIELNTELETVMVATGVGVMLCMAVWLFFRQESDGVQSLFLKMIDPFDDEIGQRSSIPLLFPPVSSGPANDLLPPRGYGGDVLNKSMRLTPLNQPKEGKRKSHLFFLARSMTGEYKDKRHPYDLLGNTLVKIQWESVRNKDLLEASLWLTTIRKFSSSSEEYVGIRGITL